MLDDSNPQASNHESEPKSPTAGERQLNPAIYDEDGIPNSGATAFVIFLLPFLAALATFIFFFVMFWPK